MKLLIIFFTFSISTLVFSQDKTLGFGIQKTQEVIDSVQSLDFNTPIKGKSLSLKILEWQILQSLLVDLLIKMLTILLI